MKHATIKGEDMTFDEVKEAGKFAWNQRGSALWTPEDGVLILYHDDIDGIVAVNRGDEMVEVATGWRRHDALADISTGWSHLPTCDCELCASQPNA